MTNGNSTENDAMSAAWVVYSQENHWGHEPTARGIFEDGWQARAALSVCADGGKGEAVAPIDCGAFYAQDMDRRLAKLSTAPQAECAPRAPDGWKLVPVMLTQEMYKVIGATHDGPYRLWRELLDAATEYQTDQKP